MGGRVGSVALRIGLGACGLAAPAAWAGGARAEEPLIEEASRDPMVPQYGGGEAVAGELPEGIFPADVHSLRVRKDVWVRALPTPVAKPLGRIAHDTRVVWRAAQDDARPGAACPRWIAIAPAGWLCENELEPSPLGPAATSLPVVQAGRVLPDHFGEDAPQAHGKLVSIFAGVFLAYSGDGAARDAGSDLEAARPEGEAPRLPLAWVEHRVRVYDQIAVRSAPDARAPVVRKLPPRSLVVPGEVSPGKLFTSIGPDEWVVTAELHIARQLPPPPHIEAHERWIDVDIDQQVLVAYEGTEPVYATLVSSGLPSHQTPSGTFRIAQKLATARMFAMANGQLSYSAQVPWTMYYDEQYALHAAYWHDTFGTQKSHGCINLAPRDARRIFAWAPPLLPSGWTEVRGMDDVPNALGAIVRVHQGATLNPRPVGYAANVARARAEAAKANPR